MAMRSQLLWLATCCVAALVIIAAVALGPRLRGGGEPVGPEPVAAAGDAGAAPSGCDVPAEVSLRPNVSADAPPVLFVAEGEVKLLLDGQPVYTPVDAPRPVPPGEHELQAVLPGEPPLKTQVRIDAFTPALFHARAFPDLGVTLARLGAVCVSCASPLNDVELTYAKQGVRPPALLRSAATAMRSDDWTTAASALRGVPVSERKGALFLRLAAAVHAATLQPELSRRELEAIPKQEAGELPELLAAFDALRAQELSRRHEVLLSRWNKLTERFGALTRRFEQDAPGAVASGSSRFQELSRGFETASRDKKLAQEDELVTAAETTLVALVAQIRKAHPQDCAFQAEVVATALR